MPTIVIEEQEVSESYVATDIETLSPEFSFDDFRKIDLRITEVINTEPVKDANTLLKLTLDFGLDEKQAFADIKNLLLCLKT